MAGTQPDISQEILGSAAAIMVQTDGMAVHSGCAFHAVRSIYACLLAQSERTPPSHLM